MNAQSDQRIVPPAVYIKETGTPRGRGVFAGHAFKQGEIVETCPVVPYDPLPDRRLPQDLKRIVFGWGQMIGLRRRRPAIALGYGSMYNHSNPASLRVEADAANRALRLIAARDLDADEELTLNYNALGSGTSSDDTWFTINGVKLITDA